jgi:hypothetical protein
MSNNEFFSDLLATQPKVSKQFVKERLERLRTKGQDGWLDSTPEARSKGRYPKTEMERVSVKTCYWWLRARCPSDWSDQELSRRLGDPSKEGKAFERMRRSGIAPEAIWQVIVSEGVACKTDQFMSGIESRPEFSKFREIFGSSFWTALGNKTKTLLSVRKSLNAWMSSNGFVRLEAGVSCAVDDLAREFEKGADGSRMIPSRRHSYSQWLFYALEQLDHPFERLVFLGLLQREAILLGYVEWAYTIAQIIPVWIKRACPVCNFSNSIRRQQYEEFCREFGRVIYTYMLRGHIESSLESELYPSGSEGAVSGYILDKQSGFVTEDVDDAHEEWRRAQNWNVHEVNATISLGGLYLPDIVDDAYVVESMKVIEGEDK